MNYTDIETCKIWLSEHLSEGRFLHSMGTAECAKNLAKQFKLDEKKAYFTGLIHDCAKCFPDNDLKQMIMNLPDLCEGELLNPKTYHAPAGVIIARKEFKIQDEEILSAIRWHTLGKLNMTDFEKIIFIADKIETKTRAEKWANDIRKAVVEGDLNKALLACYSNTIKSLVDRNLKICKITIDIYNNLLEKCL